VNTTAWFTQKHLAVDPQKGIRAEVQVPAEATWFDGHFAGDPILPGVAQIALVTELLKRALKRPVSPQRVSRVRFKKMIRPHDTIAVQITSKGADDLTYGFNLSIDRERVCSGTLVLAERDEREKKRTLGEFKNIGKGVNEHVGAS
jgi:3-hydroxyacyl-[acyl-carrier-protein] dehydratase